LALYYTGSAGKQTDRILGMAKFLFDLSQKRLDDTGILKRYSVSCYGKQETLSDMRNEKTLKKRDPALKKGTVEYDMWFLNYSPSAPTKKSTPAAKKQKPKSRSARKTRRNPRSRFFLR
jgi:hypothetical protein